jgi:exonuclease SbcC
VKQKIDELITSINEKGDQLKAIEITHDKKDFTDELMTIKSEITALENHIVELKTVSEEGGLCPTCGQEITADHKGKLQEEQKKNVEKLNELHNECEKLEAMQREFVDELTANRDKELEITKLESDRRNAENLLTELKSNLDRINEINKSLNEHEETLKQLQTEFDIVDKMRDGYRAAQPHLRTGRINKLKYGVLSIFENMFSGRFSYFSIDKDYKMTVWDGGIPRSTYTLSGGESIALAIALRLSIVNEVGGQDLLILDEPTSHLDEDRIQQLVDVIDKIITDDQIFLVTHNDLITSVSDNVIMIKRELGSSIIEVH